MGFDLPKNNLSLFCIDKAIKLICLLDTRARLYGKLSDTPISRRIPTDRIKLKRAYEAPVSKGGSRILVDRLWPRGMKKADVAIDEWMKAIGPSTEPRKWFGHAPERWPEFQRRYRSEIRQHPAELRRLRELVQEGPVTLVCAAHDDANTGAVVLRNPLPNDD